MVKHAPCESGCPTAPLDRLSVTGLPQERIWQPCLSPQEAVSERKSAAKQKAILQQQMGKLSELEEEARERAQYLLQRASRMRMEQEDEIKEFSEVGPGAPQHHPAPQGLLPALRPA